MNMRRQYVYEHIVGFEETNLVGNVYYVNHLKWQGRCREMFLHDHAPDVLRQLGEGLALVTLNCSCEYLGELLAFDHVTLRMTLADLQQNRISLDFEYWKNASVDKQSNGEQIVARGSQQVACMRREGNQMLPAPVPEQLRDALRSYAYI